MDSGKEDIGIIKHLSFALVGAALFILPACTSGRTAEGEGPVSARARNILAADNPTGLIRVGEGFERSGQFQAALNIYGQAMAADPSLLEAPIAYARVLGLMNNSNKAISMLIALLGDHPQNPDIRLTLAETYAQVGDFKAAELFLEPMLTDTGSLNAILLGAKLAQVANDSAKAISLFDQALALSPLNPDVIRLAAFSFALTGEYQTAISMVQPLMDRSNSIRSGQEALLTVYALSGQFGAAMQIARALYSPSEAQGKRFLFQYLPQFSPEEKTRFLMFNQIPVESMMRLRDGASN